MSFDYDLLVIGAGSGGVRASRIAAGLGARVAIAEERQLGGTCVNVGCVPKKMYVYASEYSEHFRGSTGFGWEAGDVPAFDWRVLRDNKSEEILRLNGVYARILESAGVELLQGFARFVDAHTVEIDGKSYTAERILIATGGWPRVPDIEGGDLVLTSNEVFDLDTLPRRVMVQGGGYIAVEFAGIFNGLGCETELVYRGPLILRGFDGEVRQFIREQMAAKGVTMSMNLDIESIQKRTDGALDVRLSDGSVRTVDAVFSAIGREPKVSGLGLERAGVELDARGYIKVDDGFQTSTTNIFALGDVIGRVQLTPVALAEGMALARHWYDNQPLRMDYESIPTAVFSQPSLAAVGLTEEAARDTCGEVDVYVSEFTPMKHTLSGLAERCLMKLIVRREDQQVLGLHMAGELAAEIVQGFAVAIKAGATKADFDATIGIHPTAAEEFVTMRSPRA